MLYSHIPAPYSLYKKINQVRAGEIIKYNFSNKELEKEIYWDLSEGPDFNIFFDDNKDFESIFNKKIKEYKTSDVGFGVLLSGGIDSILSLNI